MNDFYLDTDERMILELYREESLKATILNLRGILSMVTGDTEMTRLMYSTLEQLCCMTEEQFRSLARTDPAELLEE